jgi:hypothetical protein
MHGAYIKIGLNRHLCGGRNGGNTWKRKGIRANIVTTSQSNGTLETPKNSSNLTCPLDCKRFCGVSAAVLSRAEPWHTSRKISGCGRSGAHTCISLADTWREKQRKSLDCKIEKDYECLAEWRLMYGLGLGPGSGIDFELYGRHTAVLITK